MKRIATLQIGMTADRKRGGGLDRYYFDLLRALPATQTTAIGLVLGEPADLPEPLDGVSSLGSLNTGLLGRWANLRSIVPDLVAKTDLVVSHFAPYAFPILDLFQDKPLVVHFHGPWAGEGSVEGDARWKSFLKAWLERIVYQRASRFIVLSDAFAKVLSAEYGVDTAKVHVIPGGVRIDAFSPTESVTSCRSTLGWPTDRKIVFTMRRLVRAKGLENLIVAMAEVKQRIPEALLIIAGSGPLKDELSNLVHERRLDDHVRLVGHIAEEKIANAYRAADVFVVPTIALEGFGLVVVESLACGTPTLVTPIGGLPEVVRDLSTELILDGFEVNDLYVGIESALNGSRNMPSDVECRAYAARFDWSNVARQVADVYREALDG